MMSRQLLRRLCGAAVAGFLLTMSMVVATPAGSGRAPRCAMTETRSSISP